MDIRKIIKEELKKVFESDYYDRYPDFLDPQFNPQIGSYPPVGMHAYGTMVKEDSKTNGDRYVLNHYDDDADYEEFGIENYEAANEAEEIAKDGGVTILRGQELTSILFDTDTARVIGGLWISHDNDKFSFDIALDSSYQNMGLSSKLIDAALQEYNIQKDMHDEVGDDFKMEVDVINPRLAKILQSKYGFNVVGELSQDRVLMSI
jgi:ribosomal protein S18 acetylase RimI-like enzyme